MPLNKRMSVGNMIRELHQGPNYAKTKRKHGAAVANKQAVAIAMATKRRKGK
jgi:hypothetical protein